MLLLKKHLYLFIYDCVGSSLLPAGFLWLWLRKLGLLLVAECGLLTAMASFVAEHGLWGAQTSVVAACGLRSCSSRDPEHSLNNCGA